jgi:hypothetical protein
LKTLKLLIRCGKLTSKRKTILDGFNMSSLQPFQPAYGTTVKLSVSNVSSNIAIGTLSRQVRITNAGLVNPAFVEMGVGAQTATIADLCIAPGESVVITRPIGSGAAHDNIAAICDGAVTTTLYASQVDGE